MPFEARGVQPRETVPKKANRDRSPAFTAERRRRTKSAGRKRRFPTLGRVWPRLHASHLRHHALQRLTVRALVIAAAGIPSSGLMRYLIPHIVAPYCYATPQNHWDGLFLSHLPLYLFVTDPFAVRAFFQGLHRRKSIPWAAWTVSLGCWALFAGCLFLTFFCLAPPLRKPWVENERRAFPLVKWGRHTRSTQKSAGQWRLRLMAGGILLGALIVFLMLS